MASTTRKMFGKDISKCNIERIVESPLIKVSIYTDIACYLDKKMKIAWAEIYQFFDRKEVTQDKEDHQFVHQC